MAEHNERGQRGEEEALAHLRAQGFEILEQNWRHRKEEIDIIAREGDFLVFVEVKTRSSDQHGRPEEFVSRAKQKKLIQAANAYIEAKDWFIESRFDIIAITLHPEWELRHIRDAFYP